MLYRNSTFLKEMKIKRIYDKDNIDKKLFERICIYIYE